VAGQSIVGTGQVSTPSPGETFSVRYLTAGNDGILNCLGTTSTVAATFINTYTLDGNGNLQCQLTTNGVAAPAVTLVSGITAMYIYYGVQSNTAANNQSVDCYLQAPLVTSGAYWGNVMSVQIVLVFTNPLAVQAGQPATAGQNASQAATISISRTVALMNRTGVTT
jgi:hypothetical protein